MFPLLSTTTTSRRAMIGGFVSLLACRTPVALSAMSKFAIFDSLLHYNKPDLRAYGMQQLPAVANIWRQNVAQDLVDTNGIAAAIRALPSDTAMIFIDIECWPLLQTSAAIRDTTVKKFVRVAETVRKLRPSLKFGFYNIAPAHTYWPLVTPQFPKELDEWHEANQRLRAVAELVDAVFPSLYTYYDDSNAWRTYASRLIEAARQYGKPVYPFLWFEYHDSNANLVNKEIDATAWLHELQLCREQADGVVLWGGYRRRWDNNAAWWQIAKSELALTAP